MSEEKRPDAALIPESWKATMPGISRPGTLVRHAERLLGVDHDGGERAYVRDSAHKSDADSLRFCTRDPHDSMFFPKSHDRSGEPRYRWTRQADGSALGYHVDAEAADACARKV